MFLFLLFVIFYESLRVCINPHSWGKQLVSPLYELKRKIKKRNKTEFYPKSSFIEELFVVIDILEEKVETQPDSLPITVIDPDDQPMWSSTRTVAPTPSSAIIQYPFPNNFHIKGTHMQMIRENQFDGRIRSDPHRHIANFLEINNLFHYGENQEEVVKLKTFPSSLSGEAKIWLNELNEGTITTWEEMREAFVSRYFSPAKFKRLLNDIHNFQQLDHETLIDAWLRMKDMLRTCHGHGLTKGAIIQTFYHGLDDPIQGILDTGGIFLYNTPNEAFKFLEDKVQLKFDFSKNSLIVPKQKTVVFASGININSNHAILMEKLETLATKINFEFMKIRGELKKLWDARRDDEDDNASEYHTDDDMLMIKPNEARYHNGYHNQKLKNSYSYSSQNPNHNHPHFWPQNETPLSSQYFGQNKETKTSPKEMMREWMEANESMKNQVVELE